MYIKSGKRLLDLLIVFSATLLLSPILVLVALLIKILDPGPIIFKQKRIGEEGKLFNFYKFRSMPVNTGDIPSDKVGTVQLTWVGKLIRRTSLDELPQLFNILKGDMSIVGPRPPVPSQNDLIKQRTDNGSIRYKPGLTGLAQINSFDGMKVEQKADLDGKYVQNISLINDLKIIFSTFYYLLKTPPVY